LVIFVSVILKHKFEISAGIFRSMGGQVSLLDILNLFIPKGIKKISCFLLAKPQDVGRGCC